MNGGAQWIDYAAFGIALLVAIGGVIKFVIGRNDRLRDEVTKSLDARTKERTDATGELHERIDEMGKDLANFREHVARDYATISHLRDVEIRITASIGQSETRLTAHFGKLEERLDRLRTVGGAA